jgi:CheY-like chemotaxis protein
MTPTHSRWLPEGLRVASADVHTAVSGAEAISLWSRERFDVLVCDLAMPQLDGFAVLRTLREHSLSFANGAFAIALTAHASQDDQRRSAAAGFHAHLGKPYDFQELIDAIIAGLPAR